MAELTKLQQRRTGKKESEKDRRNKNQGEKNDFRETKHCKWKKNDFMVLLQGRGKKWKMEDRRRQTHALRQFSIRATRSFRILKS
jgi:hypothetical protein